VTQKSGFVILHYGPMSPQDMSKAAKLAGKDAVIGTDAARMAGAAFAFGPSELLDDLQKRLAPNAREEAKYAHSHLSPEAIEWLATGERGLSSEAMLAHLTSDLLDTSKSDRSHPRDPADLRRCRLLLEAVPELQTRFAQMGALSKIWKRLVSEWDSLCATMDAETPNWRQGSGKAPRTYEMMKEILSGT
jgi:hypothetical protein